MVKQPIQISIIDDTSQRECATDCGEDWSSPQTIALAEQQIKDRFDENIQLQYLDLSQVTPNGDTLAWQEIIKHKNLPLPVLVVNGQPRISGLFDIRQLLDTIEVEREIGEEL